MPRKSFIFIAILIFIDQLTKYAITYAFLPGSTIEILPFFRIIYTTNTGIAFSMFQNSNTFFIIFALIALGLLGFWYIKNHDKLLLAVKLSLVFIFAGAFGNLIDRIFRGHVVDFLDFSFGTYHWPAFNAADSCITVGGIILLITLLTAKKLDIPKER